MLENRNREYVSHIRKFVLSQEDGYYHFSWLMVERGEACGWLEHQKGQRCVMLTGAERFFCACYYFAQLADVHFT